MPRGYVERFHMQRTMRHRRLVGNDHHTVTIAVQSRYRFETAGQRFQFSGASRRSREPH